MFESTLHFSELQILVNNKDELFAATSQNSANRGDVLNLEVNSGCQETEENAQCKTFTDMLAKSF